MRYPCLHGDVPAFPVDTKLLVDAFCVSTCQETTVFCHGHGGAGLKMLEEDFTTWEVSQVSQEIYWDLIFLDISRNRFLAAAPFDFDLLGLSSMSTDKRIHLTLWLNVVE